MLPLKFGSPDQFSRAREFLAQAGYNEPAVCARLGLNSLHEYLSRSDEFETPSPAQVSDPLEALVQLILVGNSLSRDQLGSVIPNAAQETLEALGILCPDPAHPERCYSPLALYPLQGLYIASDRWKNPDGSPLAKDYVFPGMHPLTHEFLQLLPQSPCDRFLDLCSGTAIAALLASQRYARQAWAVDITERATHFGEFNRRLNGLNNLVVMQGNLYEPVNGVRFDRIVAHPPYVPTLTRGAIYADGGEDGEFITRAIVQGLPRHLEPNGRFYCLTTGVEREGEPYEQRVREWLGADQSAFDIVFVAERTQGPTQFAYRATRHAKGTWEQMDEWCAHLEKLKVKNLVYGLLLIQAKESTRSAFTVRRRKGEGAGEAEAEWLRSWESTWANTSCRSALLGNRPRASAQIELHVAHAQRHGQLVPSKFTFKADYPFSVEYDCPEWVATFVSRCDGKSTALEHFNAGKAANWIRSDLPIEQFTGALGDLISHGILEIADFALPRPSSSPANG